MFRTILLLLTVFLACLCGGVQGQATQPADTSLQIYLLLGQSNMAGRAEITAAYAGKGHDRLLMLDKENRWVRARHPLHFDKPRVAGVGPGLAFGVAIAEATPEARIGLVPCAVGGTSIDRWQPGAFDKVTGTHPWDDALVRIREAMRSGTVKGVLWHQGEGDSNPEAAAVWLDKLAVLIARLREETGNPELPFVAGELGRYRERYQLINKELSRLPETVPHTAVVSSEGLRHKGDGTHLNAPSADLLGERFASAMLELQGRFASARGLLAYVDPLIGTARNATLGVTLHGGAGSESYAQTFPAVGPPFAHTNWTPQTRATEQKCIAPYYYTDSLFSGFRGSHWLSGSCVQDYGSVTIMPLSGSLRTRPEEYATPFYHDMERAGAACYRVTLPEYDLEAKLSATTRCGFLELRTGKRDSVYLLITPNSDEGEGYVEIDRERNEIRGYNPVHRIYQGSGQPAGFSGYFVVQFDRTFNGAGVFDRQDGPAGPDGERITGRRNHHSGDSLGNREGVGAYALFVAEKGAVIRVRTGMSFSSLDDARKNLEAEIPHWDLRKVIRETTDSWEEQLGKITVNGGTASGKTVFYTALYHTMLAPRVFSDVDGTYPRFDNNRLHRGLETTGGFTYYDDFSMWDVYRAQLPLHLILSPSRSLDFARSLTAKARQGGWLPIFPCWNSYTAAMIGDHVTAYLADAYLKGIRGFDVQTAYKYMRQNAFETPGPEEYRNGKGRRALLSYLRYGYVPMEDKVPDAFHKQEQVSRTLEYAYDDHCLAMLAGALGKEDDFDTLSRRALNYRNVIDPVTGFARGRHSDGSWVRTFNPDIREPFITEGTPRQYTWYVPHDINGLVRQMGGERKAIARLDSMFGQDYYWHGNEPGHQTAFLYHYLGQPWNSQKWARRILGTEYATGAGGLSGNDDAGQMSAWYVFAAMGLYPVSPVSGEYVLMAPLFDKVEIKLGNGKVFRILKNGRDGLTGDGFIRRAVLNGRSHKRSYLTHAELLEGGTLELKLSGQPSGWGTSPASRPTSLTK